MSPPATGTENDGRGDRRGETTAAAQTRTTAARKTAGAATGTGDGSRGADTEDGRRGADTEDGRRGSGW